jgi:hypothetical protein
MRREKVVEITAEGRDHGKVFLLTEMAASQAEDWAARALLGLLRGGVDVPDDVATAGLQGLARFGLRALATIPYAELRPLMLEMFSCVKVVPSPTSRGFARDLEESDTEEVATRLRLRAELIELHTGFSMPGSASTPTSGTAAAAPSSNTQTSPAPKVRFSPRG